MEPSVARTRKVIARWLLAPVSLFGFAALFLMGALSTSESYNEFAPYCDTRFAPDYTPEKFDQVTVGMSEAQVRQLVGLPLFQQLQPNREMATALITEEKEMRSAWGNSSYEQMRAYYDVRAAKEWVYTNDGKLAAQDDFAWYRSSVSFDSAGVVLAIDKGWSYD